MIYQVTELLSVKAGFEPSFNFEVSTLLQLASMLNPVLWKRKPDDFVSPYLIKRVTAAFAFMD